MFRHTLKILRYMLRHTLKILHALYVKTNLTYFTYITVTSRT